MRDVDMLKKLPPYYRTSRLSRELLGADAQELTRLDTRIEAVKRQFFVSTADATLGRWETEVGLAVHHTDAPDYRRARIISKQRGAGTVTVKMVQNVAQSFSNSENTVIEHYSAYRFTIKFIGTIGIPPNMADLATAIEDCRPAHLAFDFAYTYNTHGNLSHFTHEAMRPRTHQELREANLN